MGSIPFALPYTDDVVPVSNKYLVDIKANIECGLTVKSVPDMMIGYLQIHCAYKYSQLKSIIYFDWPIG